MNPGSREDVRGRTSPCGASPAGSRSHTTESASPSPGLNRAPSTPRGSDETDCAPSDAYWPSPVRLFPDKLPDVRLSFSSTRRMNSCATAFPSGFPRASRAPSSISGGCCLKSVNDARFTGELIQMIHMRFHQVDHLRQPGTHLRIRSAPARVPPRQKILGRFQRAHSLSVLLI